jgi:hypothetical protein
LLKRLLPVLALLSALLVPATAGAAVTGGIVHGPKFPANEVEQAKGIGAKWVRIYFKWSEAMPGTSRPSNFSDANPCGGVDMGHLANFRNRIKPYADAGIGVAVQVLYTPPWALPAGVAPTAETSPPANMDDYGIFMKCMAEQFAAEVGVWEVWNEPDDNLFWMNGPEPAKYAAMLKATYPRVKAGDPDARVFIGGLVGNDTDFMDKLYANGAKGNYDGIDVHLSTACLTVGPNFYYREENGKIGRNSFSGHRELRQTMLDNGDDKPLWLEIGWGTYTGDCIHAGPAGREEGRLSGVPEDKQAEFLRHAAGCATAESYIENLMWFSYQDVGGSNDWDRWMGLIKTDGSPKLAHGAFRELFTGIKPPTARTDCGTVVDREAPAVQIPSLPSIYFNRFVIKGSATDGRTKVTKIEFWVDGKRVEGTNQEGGTYNLDWFGSTKLGLGKHKIELRAFDEAKNVGTAVKEITKVDPSKAPRTATARITFSAKKRSGRRVVINARVLRALTGDFTEDPKGRLQIFFDRKKGSKWIQTSRFTKGIGKKIAFTYKAKKPGTWRVRAQLAVDAPYKNTKLKPKQFKL